MREVLLVDDSDADNYLNKRVLKRLDCAEKITVALNGREALDYLAPPAPGPAPDVELIILDINMPIMNGWEFLECYEALPGELRRAEVLMMLSTSMSPADEARARGIAAVDYFQVKPLTADSLLTFLKDRFPGRF